jgi:hypothetical protein
MPGEEAEIRRLNSKRREEGMGASSGSTGSGAQAEVLIRSSEEMNATTIGRIAETEAKRCVPVLEQAARQARRAKQLRAMAQFVGDKDTARELETALRRLAGAAES